MLRGHHMPSPGTVVLYSEASVQGGEGGVRGTNFLAALAWAVLTGPCLACCCEAEVGEEPISVVRHLRDPSSSHYRFFSVLNNSRKACPVSSHSSGSRHDGYCRRWVAAAVDTFGWFHTVLADSERV